MVKSHLLREMVCKETTRISFESPWIKTNVALHNILKCKILQENQARGAGCSCPKIMGGGVLLPLNLGEGCAASCHWILNTHMSSGCFCLGYWGGRGSCTGRSGSWTAWASSSGCWSSSVSTRYIYPSIYLFIYPINPSLF